MPPPITTTSGITTLPQHPHGGVAARRAHDAAAGVRRRSSQIQPVDWRRVSGGAGRRPQEEQLLERQLPLKDVAFGQAELAFQIDGREYLAVQNQRFQVRSVFR